MTKFLCVQHTYDGIEAAIFQDYKLIKKVCENKKRSSKFFVTMLKSLLEACDCHLQDLSFIAANKGPGPFTTLRVVLASCNGLALSINKPLIGVDGLDAILQEFSNSNSSITVALLDAYSKDVYFGIGGLPDIAYKKGCKNSSVFLEELKSLSENKKIYFIGDASQKYQQEIISLFGKNALLDSFEDQIRNCSIESIGKIAFEKWEKQEGLVDQILPIYLKSMELNY